MALCPCRCGGGGTCVRMITVAQWGPRSELVARWPCDLVVVVRWPCVRVVGVARNLWAHIIV